MPAHTVASLADLVGGVVFGPGGEREVHGVADLRNAGRNELSFLANRRYESLAQTSQAAAILVNRNEAERFSFTRIAVESPSLAFGQVCQLFAAPRPDAAPGVHPTAVVAPDALLGPDVSIQPHAVISAGVRLGARCHIGANSFIGAGSVLEDDVWVHPLVTIRERSQLGARVIVHSGAVIGADGFGYELREGRHVKIEHTGYVQIDADAEIGANTTIDRGRFGATQIGTGVKIDNLVQIAHNVTIGPHSIIVAQTGISGSTSLGHYVTLAGQVGLAGHLVVGDRAVVTAQSGVTKDVPGGAVLSGRHAWPLRECLRVEALLRRLPELFSRLKKLESSAR